MIGYLSGKLQEIYEDTIILTVGGVGYNVFLSKTHIASLGPIGSEIDFRIETIVREDCISLYGFQSRLEQKVFNLLTSVSGIGPKQAIQILSNSAPTDLATAISELDTGFLESMRGIGRKTAEKIILELKRPMAKLMNSDEAEPDKQSSSGGFRRDLVLALTQLGYKQVQIDTAISQLPKSVSTLEQAIKECLSSLAGNKGSVARP